MLLLIQALQAVQEAEHLIQIHRMLLLIVALNLAGA